MDRLSVMTIEDRNIRSGRPKNDVSNLVSARPRPGCRDRARQLRELLSPEEVVHDQREREKRTEVPCRFVVGQGGVDHRTVDSYAYPHGAYLLTGWNLSQCLAASVGRAGNSQRDSADECHRHAQAKKHRFSYHGHSLLPGPQADASPWRPLTSSSMRCATGADPLASDARCQYVLNTSLCLPRHPTAGIRLRSLSRVIG